MITHVLRHSNWAATLSTHFLRQPMNIASNTWRLPGLFCAHLVNVLFRCCTHAKFLTLCMWYQECPTLSITKMLGQHSSSYFADPVLLKIVLRLLQVKLSAFRIYLLSFCRARDCPFSTSCARLKVSLATLRLSFSDQTYVTKDDKESPSGDPIKCFHGIYLGYPRYMPCEGIYQVYIRYILGICFSNNISKLGGTNNV
jgi:hypothetical protein